jgi:DNA invertase Pin-like site-specific DNA recombinase
MKVYAYLQLNESEKSDGKQRKQMEDYLELHDIDYSRIVEEVVSASVKASSRDKFMSLQEKLESGDVLLVTEFQRLGRYRKDSLDNFKSLRKKGIIVGILNLFYFNDWTMLQNTSLYPIVSKLFIQEEEEIVFIQHKMLSGSTLTGMKKATDSGKKVGRPHVEMPPQDFCNNYKQYKHGSLMGFSLKQFCKFCGISKSCYYKWVRLIEAQS